MNHEDSKKNVVSLDVSLTCQKPTKKGGHLQQMSNLHFFLPAISQKICASQIGIVSIEIRTTNPKKHFETTTYIVMLLIYGYSEFMAYPWLI